jgi:hypothetical protein
MKQYNNRPNYSSSGLQQQNFSYLDNKNTEVIHTKHSKNPYFSTGIVSVRIKENEFIRKLFLHN